LDLPEPGPDEVLIRSRVVGLCRSDIELLHGHLDAQLPVLRPIVPGHEWCGEVVRAGERAADRFRPGDRVIGECVLGPNHWFGFTYHGAASREFLAPAALLHRLPDELDDRQGAIVEPFTIAYAGIRRSGGCDGSDVVAIVGAGMIGLAALAIARANGSTVVVIEPDERRRALAERLGADVVLSPGPDVDEQLRTRTDSEGASLVIEASGNARGLAATFGLARFAGRITAIGICADKEVTAPLPLVQAKDLVLRGTTGSAGFWPDAIRFLLRHRIDLSPVVTATFPMQEAADAIKATGDPQQVKVQLTF
jgi:L-iditol 2-dehydrogenase